MLAGLFWFALKERSWLWQRLGPVTRVVVPLAPALVFGSLFAVNQATARPVPTASGGGLTPVALLLSGLWLTARIRSQHVVERAAQQTPLLAWTGSPPFRTRLTQRLSPLVGSMAVIPILKFFEGDTTGLLSLETYLPTLIGGLLGAGLVATIAAPAFREESVTTYTAFEHGLLIETIRFVPASDITGYELTDSTLVIETESRLDTLLGTTRFGARMVRLKDLENPTEVCRILDQYQVVGESTYQSGPDRTPTA